MENETWLEARKLDRYGLSDDQTNSLAAGIVKERAAWARLVKATADEMWERDHGAPGTQEKAEAERQKALHALRDLGVDVDALLEER